MAKKRKYVRIASMDSNQNIENIDLLRSYILKLTGTDIFEVEKLSLTSAQKARTASWCEYNNIQVPDLNNPSFWTNGIFACGEEKYSFPELKAPNAKSNQENCIGIDIQKISEFMPDEESFKKSHELLLNIFTLREISYAESKSNPRETIVGIFALKEAIFKARNIQIKTMTDIEIRYENSKPLFSGFSLSVSHSRDYVVAVAVFNNSVDISTSHIFLNNNLQEDSKNEKYQLLAVLKKIIHWVGLTGGVLYLLHLLVG